MQNVFRAGIWSLDCLYSPFPVYPPTHVAQLLFSFYSYFFVVFINY